MNKNIIFTFLFIVMASLPSFAQDLNDTLVIKKMNIETVQIGKGGKTIGDTFYMNETIHWPGSGGSIYAQNKRTKEYYIFTQSAFESKSAGSVSDYILTCKASTRGTSNQIHIGRNKENYLGEKRVAFLIGNSNYLYDAFLKNPVSDVENVAKELQEYGFDTYSYFDCNTSQMRSAITTFHNKAKDSNVALFYYAGHGLSWGNRYYYLPIDVELETESSLNSCIEGHTLLEQLKSDDRVTLVLLDACRSRKTWNRGTNVDVRVQMEAPRNMAIIFSTTDGGYALDGDGDLSPFAEGFITSLRSGRVSFDECAIGINRFIDEKTGHRQNSSQSSGLMENFYFSDKTSSLSVSSHVGKLREEKSEKVGFSTSKTVESDFKTGETAYKAGKFESAFRLLLPLAQKGYSDAYFYVADMYHRGLGVRKDRNEAERWYKKAAEAGNAKANNILLNKF